jgi:hypothetical protein
MHRIDPAAMSEDQARRVWQHFSRVVEKTPESRIAADLGRRRPDRHYHLDCPSDSHPPRVYAMRVHWDPEQGVAAGHYGRLCEAAELGVICWHDYAAVLRVALKFYGGLVPVAADPEPSSPDPGPEPPRGPERPTTVGATWYD